MELNNFRWEVKTNDALDEKEMKFETGITLGLPCTWRFRFFNPNRHLLKETTTRCASLTYAVDLELVDCPRNKPSVFAAFKIVCCDWAGADLGKLDILKRELEKGQPNVFLLNLDYCSRPDVRLKISFKMYSDPSLIQKNQKSNVKEALLLIEKKSKTGILEDNQNLLEQEESFSDFRIKMSDTGTEFPVHKVILASRSTVFRTMFNSGMKEAKDGIMEIRDLSTKALEIILKFIYFGTMSEGWTDVVQELIYAGSKYEMKILKEFCDTILLHICSLENAIDLLKLARKFKLKRAEKDIMAWISENMKIEDLLNDYVLEEEEAS